MKKKIKDRHLDAPAEANRDKHINFTAIESGDRDPREHRGSGQMAAGESKKDSARPATRKKN